MMELSVIDCHGQPISKLAVSPTVFGRPYNESLVHQLVITYLSNARQGTRAQKTRSEVAKSTRKPWRQKGTGRARAGMASSPLWRGGGRAFPSSPNENFSKKINRKMFRVAMSCIYSRLVEEGRLFVIGDFSIEQPKTKILLQHVQQLGLSDVLYISQDIADGLRRSSRNVPNFCALSFREINPISLLKFQHILLESVVVPRIEEALSLC